MKITGILKPNKAKLKTFLFLFSTIHLLDALLVLLVIGFWEGQLGLGIPISFYKIGCGMKFNLAPCMTGLNIFKLILDLLIWYLISSVINRNK